MLDRNRGINIWFCFILMLYKTSNFESAIRETSYYMKSIYYCITQDDTIVYTAIKSAKHLQNSYENWRKN